MSDVRAGVRQDFQFRIVQMNTMSERNVPSGEAERMQISDVALARLALDHLDLGPIL